MNNIWYDSLKKPYIMPEAKVFSAVWSVLYFMIFASFLLVVFKNTSINKTYAFLVFFAQLLFNFLWVFCFFKLNNIKLSLFVSIALAILVFVNIVSFWQISRLASFLIMPYFVWCCFAIFLNYEIFALNCK